MCPTNNKITKRDVEQALNNSAPNYAIERVYLFGSVAREENNENSDVDLCLETTGNFSLFDAGAFGEDIKAQLNCPVDIVTENSCRNHVKDSMLNERVLVYVA